MSNHVCNGAVVKGLLARADKPGSTPGDAVFFFFFLHGFFPFGLVSVFNTIFLLACCFLFLLLTLPILYLDQYIF